MSGETNVFNPLVGYRQVEQFESDDEDEYEEETMYITLDLGQLDPSLLPNATSYKLIGLETPTPFLQIGGSTFKGNYESLLGTEVILQDSTQSATSSRTLQPVTTTSERIRFREVHLVPKNYPGDPQNVGDDDNGNGNVRAKTLGGVSREKTAAFFPIASKEPGLIQQPAPKGKRRWHKRPEGYHTDEEEGGKDPVISGTAKSGNAAAQAGDTEGTRDTEQEDQEMTVEADGKEGP